MQKIDLKEIKSGQIGTGLLIEQDGYISMMDEKNKPLFESIKLNENNGDGKFFVPNPFIVSAVFQKSGVCNHNGRIYPEDILKREVEKYQVKIREREAYGEADHPSDSTISTKSIAMNIVELFWERQTLMGKLQIITSEGFRRHGVISCQGDQIANLLLSNLKIGVSSRAVGSVENKMGKFIVGNDLELIAWDVVTSPSTPGAWIASDLGKLSQYVENTKNTNPVLNEKINKIESLLIDF